MMSRVGHLELFQDAGDYEAFEKAPTEAIQREPTMRLWADCLMPNYFHPVLWDMPNYELSAVLTRVHRGRDEAYID